VEITMRKLAQGEAAGEDKIPVWSIKAGRPIGYLRRGGVLRMEQNKNV
jgi:hypothetical protein